MILYIILKANFGTTSDFKDSLLEKELISNLSYMTEIFDDYVVIMFTIDSEYSDDITIISENNKYFYEEYFSFS